MKWRNAVKEKPTEDMGLDLIVIIPNFRSEKPLWSNRSVYDMRPEIVTLWWNTNKDGKRECLFEDVNTGYGRWVLPEETEEYLYEPFFYWIPLDEFEWPISPYVDEHKKECDGDNCSCERKNKY